MPLLARLLRRARRATGLTLLAVATSTSPDDDDIDSLCRSLDVPVVRGPLDDVLARYCLAARELNGDVVVRLTADCPLMDAGVIDRVIERFLATGVDYASNAHPPTFPDGLDVEVISRAALEIAGREAQLPSDREHVTLFVHRQPDRFALVNVASERDLSAMRWTVDYDADLEFVREVYRAFPGAHDEFTMNDVLELLERRPELKALMPRRPRDEGLQRSLREDIAPRPI